MRRRSPQSLFRRAALVPCLASAAGVRSEQHLTKTQDKPRNPGPIQCCRQRSCCKERDDEHRLDSKCAADACSPAADLAARITSFPEAGALLIPVSTAVPP